MIWMLALVAMLVLPWLEFWLMMRLDFSLVTAAVLGLVTAGVGWWLSRREGPGLWSELESDIQNGRVPTAEALDAMMVVIGGWALIVPGLMTDLLGGALMMPAMRRIVMEPLRRTGPVTVGTMAL